LNTNIKLDLPAAKGLTELTRELLKEAAEALKAWIKAVDEKLNFERENPNDVTKKWDRKLFAIEAAEDKARSTLTKIEKHLKDGSHE